MCQVHNVQCAECVVAHGEAFKMRSVYLCTSVTKKILHDLHIFLCLVHCFQQFARIKERKLDQPSTSNAELAGIPTL